MDKSTGVAMIFHIDTGKIVVANSDPNAANCAQILRGILQKVSIEIQNTRIARETLEESVQELEGDPLQPVVSELAGIYSRVTVPMGFFHWKIKHAIELLDQGAPQQVQASVIRTYAMQSHFVEYANRLAKLNDFMRQMATEIERVKSMVTGDVANSLQEALSWVNHVVTRSQPIEDIRGKLTPSPQYEIKGKVNQALMEAGFDGESSIPLTVAFNTLEDVLGNFNLGIRDKEKIAEYLDLPEAGGNGFSKLDYFSGTEVEDFAYAISVRVVDDSGWDGAKIKAVIQ
jgi:archaellum component FlaC